MQLTTALKITDTYKTGNEYAKSQPDWLQYGVVYLAQYKEAQAMADKFHLFFDYEMASMGDDQIKSGECYKIAVFKVQKYFERYWTGDTWKFVEKLLDEEIITK